MILINELGGMSKQAVVNRFEEHPAIILQWLSKITGLQFGKVGGPADIRNRETDE
jgi:hypothetical protein